MVFPFDGDLQPDSRRKLISWLKLPETRLALQLIEQSRPTVWVSGSGTNVKGDADQQKTVNRLHQLQGWEMYKNSLFALADPEPEVNAQIEETFPTEINEI